MNGLLGGLRPRLEVLCVTRAYLPAKRLWNQAAGQRKWGAMGSAERSHSVPQAGGLERTEH